MPPQRARAPRDGQRAAGSPGTPSGAPSKAPRLQSLSQLPGARVSSRAASAASHFSRLPVSSSIIQQVAAQRWLGFQDSAAPGSPSPRRCHPCCPLAISVPDLARCKDQLMPGAVGARSGAQNLGSQRVLGLWRGFCAEFVWGEVAPLWLTGGVTLSGTPPAQERSPMAWKYGFVHLSPTAVPTPQEKLPILLPSLKLQWVSLVLWCQPCPTQRDWLCPQHLQDAGTSQPSSVPTLPAASAAPSQPFRPSLDWEPL